MGKPFAKVCREAGVMGVIFFPQAGPKSLEGFVTAAFDLELTPIVGLVMTHDAYLESEGGYIVDGAPDRMADAAIKLGVTDFVLPGTKLEIVKRFAVGRLSSVKSASVMMPGIGSQGGSLKTAFAAAMPCRRFAIVGSATVRNKPRNESRTSVDICFGKTMAFAVPVLCRSEVEIEPQEDSEGESPVRFAISNETRETASTKN
jgi:orotidine-5'-phosphate decarboxylase